MTEDFLHYIWKYQNFRFTNLKTVHGQIIEVQQPGFHNHNSGPDFFEAVVRIANNIWAGSVEIHVKSSDWFKHGHQNDPAYNNVVIHVVYEHDREVVTSEGVVVPELELKGLFDEYAYWRFEQLVQHHDTIPCANQLHRVQEEVKTSMVERSMVERLESKNEFVKSIWRGNKRSWYATSYQMLCYGFGLKVNAHAMLELSKRAHVGILSRESWELLRVESILFGTAGLINGEDKYSRELMDSFKFLQSKFNLDPMPKSMWKYARMRPHAFPETRIAQLAGIIHKVSDLPGLLLSVSSLDHLRRLLRTDIFSEYWLDHYRFGVRAKSQRQGLRISETMIDRLIINVFIPLRFAYAKNRKCQKEVETCLEWMEEVKLEANSVLNDMKSLGFVLRSASDSQGLTQLFHSYCRAKKCLNCSIGTSILRSE